MSRSHGAYPKSSADFAYSPKSVIKQTATSLMERLFSEAQVSQPGCQKSASSENSIQDGIEDLLKPTERTLERNLDKDIKLLEATGDKSASRETSQCTPFDSTFVDTM